MLMTKHESSSEDHHLFEHTVVIWEDVSSIQYKFRIGDGYYLHDDSAPTSWSPHDELCTRSILTANSIRWFWRIKQHLPHSLDS
jgi:hypothetical protein